MWAMARRRPGLRGSLAIYLLLAVALAPVVGGVIGGTISSLSGVDSPWWIITSKWWLGDALGVLVVGTALLAWSRLSPYEARAPWLETVAMVVVAVSVTLLPAILFDHPTLYAALPILLWAALRGGSRSVSLAAAGIAFAANWATVTGRVGNLVHGGHATDQLVFVQVFLGVTITSALIVAVEVAARVQAESHARAADVERDIALRAAEGATDEERRRIAREIHDIVGHALNVVLLQAGAARRVLTTDPALTTHLLESIEDVGRDAFRNLDIALRLMEDGGPLTPSNNLAGIPRLVETMAQAGISVELDMEDHAHLAIPIATEWAAFRLVQESLTNVAKHAPNAHVLVSISFESDRLCLSIIDDGTGSQPTRGAGRGLQGMHQRAEILGGHVEFGTAPEGGFAVRAELPGDALADA
jgi:signal transduction histidine kinase